MKSLAHAYASALMRAAEGGNREKAFSNFMEILSRRGHRQLLPQILKHVEGGVAHTATKTRITVAHEGDAKKFKSEIAQKLKELELSDGEIVIDESLIGGYRIEGNHVFFDRSHKRALVDLYTNMIS